MPRIMVVMKNGVQHQFQPGRVDLLAGGRHFYLKYEPGFVVVSNDDGESVSLPTADVERVQTFPEPRF